MSQKTKGVLDSFIFTPAQKAEYYRLLQLGIPDVQARALAQALKKSAKLAGPTLADLPQPDSGCEVAQAVLPVDASQQTIAEDGAAGVWRALAKSGYHSKFVAEAKKRLGQSVFADIHNKARSSAGGSASGLSRRAAANPSIKNGTAWLDVLRGEIKATEDEISKAGPCRSEGHVDRPLSVRIPKPDFQLEKKETLEKKVPPQGVRSACKRGLELAPKYGGQGLTEGAKARARSMAAGEAQTQDQLRRMKNFFSRHGGYDKPSDPPSPGYVAWQLWGGNAGRSWANTAKQVDKSEATQLQNAGTPESDPLPQGPQSAKLNAQRLIAGIDYHMGNGTDDVATARTLASRMLSDDMGVYDNLYQRDSDLRGIVGLDVDLGSGSHRAPGYLGIDLHPYDYGTAIFDITDLPLPFDNGEVRSLRMVDVPLDGLDVPAFLQEVQRVLTYGGQFFYAGPVSLNQSSALTKLPGLELVATNADDGNLEEDLPVYIETYARVRARLPWVYGADTNWLSQPESSIEQLMLNQALDVPVHTFAEQAMANLLTKSNSFGAEAKVVKAEQYQRIVTSVVYAPDELDTDGEWMNAADIEQAAHTFLMTGGYIGSEHGGKAIGAQVVESYIAPCDMTFDTADGPQAVPKGSWIMSVKFSSEAEWKKVLDGTYTGFSVGGFAAVG